MSVAITITGHKSVLESSFQPPIILDGEYECGLLHFSALNSIPNINHSNNIFAYGDKCECLKIPYGTYDLYDIRDYVASKLDNCEIKIKPNNNTLTCSLFCSKTVHFDVENSLGHLLGFPNVKLEGNKWHESVNSVNILPLSVIRIECDLIFGSYNNGYASHIIYEFIPNVPPGYRYIEIPKNIIYLPVNKNNISSITVKIIDENGNNIDFREENIQLKLHLRRAQ